MLAIRLIRYFKNHNIYDFFIFISRGILLSVTKRWKNQIYKRIVNTTSFPKLTSSSAKSAVIVSMTTFPKRYNEVVVSIKSLLLQKQLPDKIILYLGTDCDVNSLPEQLLELQQYGVEIKTGYPDIRPHKKYFFAMQEYPDNIIITVDDDLIYDKFLISDLLKSYKRYPNAISATRVHRMLVKNEIICPYNKWDYEYTSLIKPSLQLLSTNGAGTLFPPHILPDETFDIEKIQKYALNADDIWLKFMMLRKQLPVVLCNRRRPVLEAIQSAQQEALSQINVIQNKNDEVIDLLQKKLGINLAEYGYKLK